MKEIWKDVEGYTGLYQVSNLGRVKSIPREITNGTGGKFFTKPKIMNRHLDTTGYYTIALCKGGIMRKTKLHQIIAIAFIPNPENKPHINHKDSVRTNYSIENLEWCTPGENLTHCYKEKRRKGISPMKAMYGNKNYIPRPVTQYSLDGIFINSFPSLAEASRQTGVATSSIGNNCARQRKTCYGFVFKYTLPD